MPGRIVWDQPADHLVIDLVEAASRQPVDRAHVTPDGQFELHVPNESTHYELRVQTMNGDPIKTEYLMLRANTPIEIRLQLSRIQPNPAGPISVRHLLHKPQKEARKLVNQAERFAAGGDLPHSIAQLQAAAVADPEWFEVWGNLGARLMAADQPEPALEAFRHAVAIDPSAAAAQISLALVLLRLHRPQEAETAAAHALRLNPDSSNAAYAAGLALAQQNKNRAEAIRLLDKAGPALPAAYLAKAQLQCVANQWNACAASLRTFLQSPPSARHGIARKWLQEVETMPARP